MMKIQERLGKKGLSIVIIAFILIFSIISFSYIEIKKAGLSDSSSLSNHPPITITSNSEFTSTNGVVRGSGTSNDPYYIENWTIDGAQSSNTTGIAISGTTAYFIINNCHIYLFDQSSEYGINLSNVENGTIQYSQINNTNFGISLSTVKNIEITQVEIQKVTNRFVYIYNSQQINCTYNKFNESSYLYGIELRQSNNIEIGHNEIENVTAFNYGWSIYLEYHPSSNWVNISHNIIKNGYRGLWIREAHRWSNTKIDNNTLENMEYQGFDFTSSTDDYSGIRLENNTANNCSGGGFIIAEDYKTFFNNWYGNYGNGVNVDGAIVSDEKVAYWDLDEIIKDSVTVTKSTDYTGSPVNTGLITTFNVTKLVVKNSTYTGGGNIVYPNDAEEVIIENSSFNYNNIPIQLPSAIDGAVVKDSYFNFSKSTGISSSANSVQILRNTFRNCSLAIGNSGDNIIISHNDVYNGTAYSVYLSGTNNTFSQNTIENSSNDGLRIMNLYDSHVSNNKICYNGRHGIRIDPYLVNVWIENNNLSNNAHVGLSQNYQNCKNSWITNNTVLSNGWYGLQSEHGGGKYLVWHNNTCKYNVLSQIVLEYMHGNYPQYMNITNNTLICYSSSSDGIRLSNNRDDISPPIRRSNYFRVENNTIRNGRWGIYIRYSENNSFYNNQFTNMTKDYYLSYSNNNYFIIEDDMSIKLSCDDSMPSAIIWNLNDFSSFKVIIMNSCDLLIGTRDSI